MARRWRWYLRDNGRIDVPGPPVRVDVPPAPAVNSATVAALNETGVHDRAPVGPVALYRARTAWWRWPG